VRPAHRSSVAGSAPATSTRAERYVELLVRWTRDWSFVGALVLGYVLIGLRALATDRYLDDEGILTYLYAEFLRRDFTATIFWFKSHPALALLNLPGAALGLNGFFVLHVLIGAAGIVLIAIAARRAGIREVGIAPLVMATSPLYVQGGASGVGNVDGVAMASGALALWLTAAPGLTAGLVTGALPFVRFELGLLTMALAAGAATRGSRWRFLAGVAAVPFAYFAAGALYHGSPWWFVTFPPAWAYADPAVHTVAAASVSGISVGALMRSLGLTLPALPLLLVPRTSHGGRPVVDMVLEAYVVTFIAAITLLPLAHIAFGFSDRYYLTALPAVALLAARAVDAIAAANGGGSHRTARAVVAAICAVGAAGARAWGLVVMSSVAAVATTGARMAGGPRVAATAALMLVVLGLTLPPGYQGHAELRTITAWLRAHRSELGAATVYTNFKLLSAFASRSGDTPGFDIAGLIQPDMRLELLEWSNPANGQQERIWGLVHDVFYGRGADPRDIVEGRAPAGSLLVLDTGDIRTEEMFPPSFLRAHTRTLSASPGVLIAMLLPRATADSPQGSGR
jgi:hypothetical protein